MNSMKPFGLGDLAYYIFRPFVYFTDWVWGTDLKDCIVCKERRKAWNARFTRPAYVWVAFAALIILLLSIR